VKDLASLEALGTIITTDVLVVGHGIAGLSAAISVKETDPRLKVMSIDKACLGYGGKSNKGGGHVAFIPEGAEEAYVEYHTRNIGDYLNDQDFIRDYANSTIKVMDRWATWGVNFLGRDEAFNAHPLIPWKVCVVDTSNFLIKMGQHARKLGVDIMEKVTVTDLLTNNGRIVGAIGFSLLTGTTYIYKAGAVILANGDQNFRVMRMWNSGRGDGIAAAYRAGAKMRNAEFGSFMNIISLESKHVLLSAEDELVNAHGKRISERENLDESMRTVVGGADIGGAQSVLMYLEIREGNGPIYADFSARSESGVLYSRNDFVSRNLGASPDADPAWQRPGHVKRRMLWDRKKQSAYGAGNKREVGPGLVGECSPVYVDQKMASNVPGLYLAGDICQCGSSWSGAVPTPPGRNRGSGLMSAVWSGQKAGDNAADYLNSLKTDGAVNTAQVEELKTSLYSAMDRYEGYTTDAIIWGVQNIMQPIGYSNYKSEDRMNEALDKVLVLKSQLPRLVARDWHDLSAVNECRSMVLCAEMFYRASFARKESRGWHLREDYTERDDKNFLKWIFLQDKRGEMEISFVNVPIETYQYRPDNATRK
jgi:succinate dehydrogenase/fumarate reductase flavoprotein subunit